MSYRPITDVMILARSRVGYYGAYPGGFRERARYLLGVGYEDPILHICGGRARDYEYPRGYGPNDRTLDLDPELNPDFLQNGLDPLPQPGHWAAMLLDPPYSEEEADHYKVGRSVYPSPGKLLANALKHSIKGHMVGILHYLWVAPSPREVGREHAVFPILMGYNNRVRVFSVWEATGG